MADHILASAEVDNKGKRGIYAVIIRERDSEVIGEDEKKMQLLFAAHQAKLKVVGPIFFQYPATRTTRTGATDSLICTSQRKRKPPLGVGGDDGR